MNTQKQIIVIVALFFLTVGACAGYAVVELPYRTELQADWHFEESVERGALLYANNCRTCHGNAGEGFVGPPLNRDEWQDQDPLVLAANRELIERTLLCGRVGTQMPAWLNANGGSLNERQIEHLVNFLTAPDDPEILDENGQPTSFGWVETVHFAHNLNHEVTAIVAGDTLQTIAARHGVGVALLAELNGVSQDAVDEPLPEGEVLDLPPVAGEPGGGELELRRDNQTIAGVAESTLVGAAVLADFNGLEYEVDYDAGTFTLLESGTPVPGLLVEQILALPDGSTYSVVPGETIETIADIHGLTPEELLDVNPDLEGVAIDEDLAVPAEDGSIPTVIINLPSVDSYRVQGQGWDDVADGYGNVTGSSLAEANGLDTNIALRIGRQLSLPEDAYGSAPPDAINDGRACVQYAVPESIYEQLSGGGGLTPAPPFEGVVEAVNIAFVQSQITLPPDTEVRLVLDNQDEDILHNIQFFDSPTAGQGGFLTGCTSGCEGDGDEIVGLTFNGIAQMEMTFITPAVGQYSFNCVIHSNMTGTLTIEEGAEVPEGAQP